MSDPIGVPTFADVQREFKRHEDGHTWYASKEMLQEIVRLRAEVARLRAPSDAVCDGLLSNLDSIAMEVSLQDFGLPCNRESVVKMRAAIRAALAQGEA